MSALGRRYGKALLDLAAEQNQVDQVWRNLSDLREAWQSSDELREVFENPSVSSADRRQVIDALAGRMGLTPLVKNTLKLLSDRRRARYLGEVVEAFDALAGERAGRVRAEVVTATAMSETYYSQLQRTLEDVTGKKVTLVKRQDPSLIGGVIARVGDKVFDGSIRTRLTELKDELLHR